MKKFFCSVSIILFIVTLTFAQKKETVEKVEGRKNSRTDKPLKIIKIPRPKYPAYEGGVISARGIVRIKVQFLASGKIGEVVPVTRLGYGLTESAIEAAKEIKFEPEIKNGKAVTVIKVIPFNFSIY